MPWRPLENKVNTVPTPTKYNTEAVVKLHYKKFITITNQWCHNYHNFNNTLIIINILYEEKVYLVRRFPQEICGLSIISTHQGKKVLNFLSVLQLSRQQERICNDGFENLKSWRRIKMLPGHRRIMKKEKDWIMYILVLRSMLRHQKRLFFCQNNE